MNTLESFQLSATELKEGVTLIEASAGTGKTFAIAGLILRLVLEKSIPVSRILAVTYTVAATEELRDRVRSRFRQALEDLKRRASDDDIVSGFLRRSSAEETRRGIRDLELAVQSFDEACIFTIHGFCQRVLRENAFESGALFDMELMADAGPVLAEVARDFWRRRFYDAPPLLSRLVVAHGSSPEEWVGLLERLRNHPDIRILPGAGEKDCAALAEEIGQKFRGIAAEWERASEEVKRILVESKSLSRGKDAYSPGRVAEIVACFDELTESLETARAECLNAVTRLSNSEIAGKLKGDRVPPKHRLFDLCEEFQVLTHSYFNRLTHEFVAFAKEETPLRKLRLNIVTYDDLLTRVRDTLNGPGGAAFAAMIGGKYDAALIDEFQDTDPIQYAIFDRLFGSGKHHLYFIGDPKQAIYGFRGADVHTYLKARGASSRKFTLGTNYRSEKRLLDALNLLFKREPSLGLGIEYREVAPPEKPRPGFEELTGDGDSARLRFRFLEAGDGGGKAIGQGEAKAFINAAVVADIARLKQSGARLGGRNLEFGDMAVLVRTNAQAASLQELLRANGIKSVLQTEESVFHTNEAHEMLMLLEGVLEPGRGHFLNTALSTSLLGFTPARILKIEENESEYQTVLEQFLAYRGLWTGSCFMAMFRHLLVEQHVRERLVREPGGERMLTNFLHLSELLHRAETAQRMPPDVLRLWLRKQIHSEETLEEHQLRLESDEDGVLIATIHKSKGLEYPVVFCPFLWKPADNGRRVEVLFHDPDAENRLTLDLRDRKATAANDERAAGEKMAESLRMLYVALTRARNLCHVYTGNISKCEGSPLAHVLGGTMLAELQALARESDGSIGVTTIDAGEQMAAAGVASQAAPAKELRARDFKGSIPQTRMITSFSGLISGATVEEPDRDDTTAIESNTAATVEPQLLAGFERGARAGVFWHELLEELDFQAPGGMPPLVEEKLRSHGIELRHKEDVCDQVTKLLAVPLEPGLTLAQIPRSDRRSEVEFSFPVESLNSARLREAFAKFTGSAVADFSRGWEHLEFRMDEGFMRGFIDLLFVFEGRFYIVDWKSNWLGNRADDYAPAALQATMLTHFYFLQYHLYTVAADLFLERQFPRHDYEALFGGVFYIFLRGVDPADPTRGIFRDRPAAALVRELRACLTGR